MKRFIGRLILKLIGWEILGERPPHDKFVLIAAPHTSNWDLPIMLSIALVFDIKLHWIGKHTLFRFPYGWFMRFLGGIPIDRRAPQGMVGQVADAFRNSEKLVIVVPPEGTRGRAEYWKSGFYWMAKEAGVPIVTGVLDYKEKRGGFGPGIYPSDDIKADMDKFRAFYKGRTAKFPECFGPVRLKEEETAG